MVCEYQDQEEVFFSLLKNYMKNIAHTHTYSSTMVHREGCTFSYRYLYKVAVVGTQWYAKVQHPAGLRSSKTENTQLFGYPIQPWRQVRRHQSFPKDHNQTNQTIFRTCFDCTRWVFCHGFPSIVV